jgi:hypothetical protein
VHRQSAMGNAQSLMRPIKPIEMCMSSDLRCPRPLRVDRRDAQCLSTSHNGAFKKTPPGDKDEGCAGVVPFVRCTVQ